MIDLPPKVRPGERLKASTINALIDAVRRSRVLQSATLRVSQSVNGTILDVIPRGKVVVGEKKDNKHPFKLAVFTDENGNKYHAVYIPNGSCNVNGNISSLDNTQRLTEVVDKSEWSADKIAAFNLEWTDYYYVSSDNLYVHVFGTRVVNTETESVVSDTSQFIVNGSENTTYEKKDDSYDTEKKTKTEYTYWTFRVGGFADNTVVAQVLTDALILESGIGKDGGYYTPSVDVSGNLTWKKSNDSMPDISGSNIRGATGATGGTGATGATGKGMSDAEKQAISDAIANANGAAGAANTAAGAANNAASSATSAASSARSAASSANSAASNANTAAEEARRAAANVKDGKDGATGATGVAGKDGATGASGKDGATGASGKDGKDGATGASGKDGATGATGATGQGADLQTQGVYSGLMCERPSFDIETSTDF